MGRFCTHEIPPHSPYFTELSGQPRLLVLSHVLLRLYALIVIFGKLLWLSQNEIINVHGHHNFSIIPQNHL
jgi:hypothetical protein